MDSYRDATRPIADRVADLLSRMTLREKAGQMNQKMLGWQALERRAGRLEPTRAFEEEVALGDGLGALYGLFRADPWSGVNFANGLSVEEGPGAANRLQRYVLGKTRLGIPLLFSEECPHGHQALDASIFPTSLAVGCTWNPELYRRAYEKAAAQMRARGATLALVSCLDIAQDPRWGRCEECYGEDPYLAGRFAAAAVRGLQGEGTEALRSPQHLAMVAKHFCCLLYTSSVADPIDKVDIQSRYTVVDAPLHNAYWENEFRTMVTDYEGQASYTYYREAYTEAFNTYVTLPNNCRTVAVKSNTAAVTLEIRPQSTYENNAFYLYVLAYAKPIVIKRDAQTIAVPAGIITTGSYRVFYAGGKWKVMRLSETAVYSE